VRMGELSFASRPGLALRPRQRLSRRVGGDRDPQTGEMYWEHPWTIDSSTAVHQPGQAGSPLFFSGDFGARPLSLDDSKPAAKLMWKTTSESETVTDAVHTMIMTPIVIGDYVYGILRCLELKTGERVWATQAVTKERALHATAHFIRNGDRFFINND